MTSSLSIMDVSVSVMSVSAVVKLMAIINKFDINKVEKGRVVEGGVREVEQGRAGIPVVIEAAVLSGKKEWGLLDLSILAMRVLSVVWGWLRSYLNSDWDIWVYLYVEVTT